MSQWTKEQLGYHLAARYQKLLSSCSAELAKAQDPLPKDIRDFLWVGPADIVVPAWDGGASLDSVFSYIFTSNDIWDITKAAKFQDPGLRASTLRVNLIPTITRTEAGSDSIFRVDTCDSAVSAALKAGSKFPAGELEAALRAQAQRQDELTVMLGSFLSPLYVRLADTKQGFETRMLLWKHYADNPALLSYSKLYYLSSFRGAVTYGGSRQSSSVGANLAAEADLNFGIVNINGSVKAQVGRQTRTTIETFGVFIRKDPKDPNWKPIATLSDLDMPSDIVAWVNKNHQVVPIPTNGTVLQLRTPFLHELHLENMPREWCERHHFEVTGNKNVTLTNAVFDTNVCKLSASFDTKEVSFTPPQLYQSYSLSYSLRLRSKITHLGQTHELAWPIEMPLSRARDPYVDVQNNEGAMELVGNGQGVKWKVNLNISDRNKLIDREQSVTAESTGSTCSDVAQINRLSSVFSYVMGAPSIAALTIEYYPGLAQGQTIQLGNAPCTVTLKITIPLKDKQGAAQEPIDQTIVVRVRGPSINIPAQPLAPPPAAVTVQGPG